LIRELQPDTETGMVTQLIDVFIEEARKRITELQSAIDSGDTNSAEKLAHSLKGSSLSIGATLMASVCLRLEEDVRLHLSEQCQRAIEDLKAEFDRVVNALTVYKNGGVKNENTNR